LQRWLFYILTFSTLLLISCEEEVIFEAKNFTPKIVLNSIFTNDSIWVISLTHTTSIFDKKDVGNYITDAAINITNTRGEQVCKLYHEGKGIYKSLNCVSEYDQLYKINVYSAAYGVVSAQSKIPIKSSINSLKITISKEYINASEIEFKIEDKSPDKNYYIWSIVDVDTLLNKVKDDQNSKLDFKLWISEIKEQFVKVTSGKLSNSNSFSDLEIQSNSTTKLITNKNLKRDENQNVQTKSNIVPMLKLMTVSPELYDYYKSMEVYIKYSNSNSSLSEPQKLFSNVEGGLGIFAGYSIQYYSMPK
jgi:hypothetical protein